MLINNICRTYTVGKMSILPVVNVHVQNQSKRVYSGIDGCSDDYSFKPRRVDALPKVSQDFVNVKYNVEESRKSVTESTYENRNFITEYEGSFVYKESL